MKVCMLSYSYYEGDARIMQYASALAERGDEVDVICLKHPGDSSRDVLDSINVFRIQERTKDERGLLTYLCRILRFLIVSAAVLTKRHLRQRYSVIHVHSVPDFLVFAALLPKLLGTPVILDIHDVLPELYASKFHASCKSLLFRSLVLVERISVAFANHVIVANHLWCERVAARSGQAGKFSAIRNYPAPKLFHPRPHSRNGPFVITYPGSLNWHQGVDVAIHAFAKIKDEIPDAEFHIYGEGPAKPSLMDLSRSLGLERRVIFHSALPTAEIVRVMAASDLAIEPKRVSSEFGNEALSMKILEFMSVGVPVIVSRTKTHGYYYDDSVVKYYNEDSVDELAADIVLLRRNASLRKQLVANGLRYAQSNNWNIQKSSYLDLVDGFFVSDSRRPATARQ
jgi:glycosyltransferase involved in cell wall biosynthesis